MFSPSEVIKEQGTKSVPEYRRRVRRLATFYFGIVLFSLTSVTLLVVRGRYFVTIAQRSNVETGIIAVIICVFLYLAVVSMVGAIGAMRILYYALRGWTGSDHGAVESRKQRALSWSDDKPGSVYLNVLVRSATSDEPIRIQIEDDYGSLGTIVIDGAELSHQDAPAHSSNSIFAYFERRIEALVEVRDPHVRVSIVEWTTIDDDSALRYGSVVAFSRNLERQLGGGSLWPAVELTEDDIATLRKEARELCPILRNESFLPDLEYEAEHRLPIIPEPLAFIALSRSEKRADPHASMGCAFIITILITTIVMFMLWNPPWVPGK